MPKVTFVSVSSEDRSALEKGNKYGSTPSFRLRCRAILLKSEPHNGRARTSLSIAGELGCCEMSVNDWVKRYHEQGLAGLQVQAGRGRKGILQKDTDLAAVQRAVQANRQRVSLAKAELEKELGKEFGVLTLKRFPKKTVAASKGCESE